MKRIMILMMLIASFTFLQAQTLSIGPTAGFGHSSLSTTNNSFNKKFFPAYNIGAKMVYSFVHTWGIGVDIKFSGEGGKSVGDAVGGEYEYKYRANYIRVPVQAIYFFGKLGDAIRPKISLGPSLGFLIGGESVEKLNGVRNNSVNTSNVFDGFDFGISAAAGANFRLGGDKWLNTDFTYYYGLSNISSSASTIKNRSLGINIGVTFPIK
jgi:hypothetical protein